ncbi:MAG: alpha/beta fold hydrolase, partial [Caulobacteraceae bacterium]
SVEGVGLPSRPLRFVASVLGLILAAAPVLARNELDPSGPGSLVRLPDGRRINMRCAGPAVAPTVIFESGFAATSSEWDRVQPVIARAHFTCSYDRAGYGWSDPGPLPRDGTAVARDLAAALKAARIRGPLVLVAHSDGALFARIFADRHPHQVVGMVLVDPSVEHQDLRFAAVYGKKAGSLAPLIARAKACGAAAARHALPSLDPSLIRCGPSPTASTEARRENLSAADWKTQVSELETLWGATSDEVDAGGPTMGAMPLVVLTAAGGRVNPLWAALHDELARRSTRGSSQLVQRSGHMMMFDRPDAIIAAINEVLAAVK